MDLIGEEIRYYKDNREAFIELYDRMHLVIKGMQIIGVYKTKTEAFDETIRNHAPGTFIIERPMNLDPKPR